MQTHEDYKLRISRVFEFIDNNLAGDVSLTTVAAIAHFSPFHFHRVFKFITNETLNDYVNRQRIEKAAQAILHQSIAVTEIAMKFGYSDLTAFSRAFKKFYGVSPTAFKAQHPHRLSKIRQVNSKNGQDYPSHEKYIRTIENLKQWMTMNAKIEVKQMPAMQLAYIQCIGPQNLATSYQKLMQWAIPKGLMHAQTKMITIYHDSFKVTAANKVRLSAGMLLHQAVAPAGEIQMTTLEAGKCILGSFEIGLDEFEQAWTGLYLWMNENGYKKADRNPFEIYHNNFNDHPEKKAIVDFHIPILS